MGETIIRVKLSEVEHCAKQIKDSDYPQVYLQIKDDGQIQGSWFFGRSDFVLCPGFIVLLECKGQTVESIAYAIKMVIRNQEGYGLAKG